MARAGKYSELIELNYPFFLKHAVKRSQRSRMPMEDLFQNACLEFLQRAHNYNPDISAFTTYFTTAIDRWNARFIHYWCSGKQCPAYHPTFEDCIDEQIDQSVGQLEQVVDDELHDVLMAAINRLDEREKTIIILRYFCDKKLHEIGKVLNLSKERVRQLEGRALTRLRLFDDVRSLAD